ncbi:MAG: hypothetical protein ACE5SW_12000, partial [Nitrososphaeraceae archaeon]
MKIHCKLSRRGGLTIFFALVCMMMITAYPSQIQMGFELNSITRADFIKSATAASEDGDDDFESDSKDDDFESDSKDDDFESDSKDDDFESDS